MRTKKQRAILAALGAVMLVACSSKADGAGTKNSKHAVKLTSQGWEVKGLD